MNDLEIAQDDLEREEFVIDVDMEEAIDFCYVELSNWLEGYKNLYHLSFDRLCCLCHLYRLYRLGLYQIDQDPSDHFPYP